MRSTLGLVTGLVLAVGAAALAAAGDGTLGKVRAPAVGPDGAVSEPGLLEVGRPFPLLDLPAAEDGRPLSLADFRGRKIILHVFASW